LGHASFILFFLLLPFIISQQTTHPLRQFNLFLSLHYWVYLISFISYFYSYTYYFIPVLFLRKKYWAFAGFLFLVFIYFWFVKPFELVFQDVLVNMRGHPIRPYDPLVIDFLTNITFIMLTALGLSIQIVKQWRLSEKRILQTEADKANAELSFLKAQINPHFFFNTLNNIYSLSISQDPETSNSIMKLSELMRYIVDDATKDYVLLENEIAIIRDYIDLQQLRHSKNIKLDFSVTGNIEDKEIAPLILMTYIENAFKYGISSHEEALITIKISADDSHINFFCQNKIFATPRGIERTGIGLVNTTRRLKYLYHGKHKLTNTSENGLYTVELTLEA
jgi:hypothetical protein